MGTSDMRLIPICGALLIAGCGQPALTDAHREEMLAVAKSQAGGGAAMTSRMNDLETRLSAAEAKNLELEAEVNRLNKELKKTNEELGYVKDMVP
jgi:uncharacterized protein YlxW (UPF0749 family)